MLIASNMELTELEAKGFWLVDQEYQKERSGIYMRLGKLINSYAEAYQSGDINDEKAQQVTAVLVAIEQMEGGIGTAYMARLSKVLPAITVARYLQIKSKIRAAIRYDLASGIPLIQ